MTSNLFTLCFTAALSPLPEPIEPLADPKTKEDDEIIKMAKVIMDKVVDQLLNEAAEVV
jgi:predicted alternative tryptophan synthase beta-subunit